MRRKDLLRTLGVPAASLALPVPALVGAAETYTLRISHSLPATSMAGLVALRFAAAAEHRSNGQLKVEDYPNGQLLAQENVPNALAAGIVDFTINASAFLTPLIPQFQVFDAPFIFGDLASAYRVFEGQIGAQYFSMLDSRGIVGLGWGTAGFREFEANRPIVTPDDLKGLRIRIPGGAVYAAMIQAVGAIPVAVDLTELATALAQHTVDGQDMPLSSFTSGKYYTATKHVALSNHILAVELILGSKTKLERLPANLQRIVREEWRNVTPLMRAIATKEANDATQILKQNGVSFTQVQHAAFRKAMDPVYALVQSNVGGDLLDRVSRAAG